jgi:hypothetical protein
LVTKQLLRKVKVGSGSIDRGGGHDKIFSMFLARTYGIGKTTRNKE